MSLWYHTIFCSGFSGAKANGSANRSGIMMLLSLPPSLSLCPSLPPGRRRENEREKKEGGRRDASGERRMAQNRASAFVLLQNGLVQVAVDDSERQREREVCPAFTS
jgi:hypothetical protein